MIGCNKQIFFIIIVIVIVTIIIIIIIIIIIPSRELHQEDANKARGKGALPTGKLTYCWWVRNPKQPPGMYKTLWNYQPQPVQDSSDQPYQQKIH